MISCLLEALRPHAPTRPRSAGAGSIFLLLAAICSAYAIPGSVSDHSGLRRYVQGWETARPEHPASPAKLLLSRLSLERRNKSNDGLRTLLERLLTADTPAYVPAPTADGFQLVLRASPPRSSPGHSPALFGRPPPSPNA